MKKLIISACVVAFAAITQAATVTWKSGDLLLPGGGEPDSDISGYLFSLTAADYAKLASADDVWTNYKGSLDKATKTGVDDMGVVTLKDTKTYNAGDTAYAAIIYTATVEGKDYYIANFGEYEFKSASNKTIGNMGTQLNGSGAALTWQSASSPVPEPTTGLLLVLGMAGLALRRRRA